LDTYNRHALYCPKFSFDSIIFSRICENSVFFSEQGVTCVHILHQPSKSILSRTRSRSVVNTQSYTSECPIYVAQNLNDYKLYNCEQYIVSKLKIKKLLRPLGYMYIRIRSDCSFKLCNYIGLLDRAQNVN